MTIPRIVKVYAKTLAVFVAGWAFNVIVDLVQGKTPWPQTKEEWLQYLLTSFGVAFVALMTKNKIIQKQIDNDPNVIGGYVVDDPANKGKPMDPVEQNVTPGNRPVVNDPPVDPNNIWG